VPKVAIVFFSGYGHTARQAEAVRIGAQSTPDALVSVYRINEAGDLPSGALEELSSADAFIYGSPTYMGGPAWQFKKFADSSAKAFFARRWKDKLAAGFTNRPLSTATNIRQSNTSGRYRSSTAKSGSAPVCFRPIRRRMLPPTLIGLRDLPELWRYHHPMRRRTKLHDRATWRPQSFSGSV
jgi:hypothetical protein